MIKPCLFFLLYFVFFLSITIAHFDKVEWLSITQSAYVTPLEIQLETNYRFTIKNHQLVYFKFKKDFLEPNQKYLIEVAYPGVVSFLQLSFQSSLKQYVIL